MSRRYKETFAMFLSVALGMLASNGLVSRAGVPQETAPPKPQQPGTPPSAQPQRPDAGASSGYVALPPGAETLTTPLAENSLILFTGEGYDGVKSELVGIDKSFAAGALNEIPQGLKDGVTSLRWNLPPGVVVVLYEDAAGKGEQVILWGKGQAPTVGKWDFNDKASRWAWYNVGGGRNAPSAEAMLLPHGATPAAEAMPANSLQYFIDTNFRNDMEQVSPVTAQKAGEFQRMPKGTGDSLSSLRWNLPEGVVVVLYQDAGGGKQQTAIWGRGEIADLDTWDFNDKASRWTWSYVGAPGGGGAAETPGRE